MNFAVYGSVAFKVLSILKHCFNCFKSCPFIFIRVFYIWLRSFYSFLSILFNIIFNRFIFYVVAGGDALAYANCDIDWATALFLNSIDKNSKRLTVIQDAYSTRANGDFSLANRSRIGRALCTFAILYNKVFECTVNNII